MNILLFIDNLGSGGAQNQISLLGSNLSEQGHTVHLVTYNEGDFFLNRIIESNCQYNKLPFKIGTLKRIFQLRKYIKKNNIEYLISYLNAANIYSCFAVLGLKRLKFFPSYRSKTDFSKISFLNKILMVFVGLISDKVICNSYHEAKTLSKLFSMKSKTGTIYNGIENKRIVLKTDYNIRRKVMMVGKLREPKNAQLIISMLNKYEDLNFDIDWFGGTSFSNRQMNEYADRIIEKTKNLSGCSWTWKGVENDIGAKYSEYDFLLHPSLLEGLPNVICEAMMAGLPVLASDILDHPNLLDHDKRLLFNPTSIEDLHDKIKSFYGFDEEERLAISNTLRNRANSLLTIEHMTESYLHLLNSGRFLKSEES